ncbi:hypothetical protein F5X68DRAFT_245364 [Plectosphaerella plurivora]|uniref:Uncharacterized protein n=1 Tax=Plectosphaerella plurivora TaxID=936078 RepID=A0A9P9A7M6_9PEZI|nr:hypothetical protein F5X68DRAFT_245364 [Plectosphaerella plurivora]
MSEVRPQADLGESSSRLPSSSVEATQDETDTYFDDDASTIRPTESDAASSIFGDDASTLQPDTFAPLGADGNDDGRPRTRPQRWLSAEEVYLYNGDGNYAGLDPGARSEDNGDGPPCTRPQPWLRQLRGDEEGLLVNRDGSYAGPGAGAGSGAGRRNRMAGTAAPHRGRPRPQLNEGPDYWHAATEPAPFNPFDEVARLPQRERVALAIKNARGPQYHELGLSGSRGMGFGAAG